MEKKLIRFQCLCHGKRKIRKNAYFCVVISCFFANNLAA